MRPNRPITIIAAVAALSSWVAIALQLSNGFGPRFEPAVPREIGRVLADQAAARLKSGGTITVITRDTLSFKNPASDALLESFRAELRSKNAKIDQLETIQIDPLRPVAVPSGDFLQWIKKAPKGSVIVSFMGPPVFTDAQLAQVGEIRPALIALCSGPVRDQLDLRGLFAQGLLQAAVVTRRPVIKNSQPPATDREAFNRQYLEVTSADLSALSIRQPSSP